MIVRTVLFFSLYLSVSSELLLINCGCPEIRSIGWRKDTGLFRSYGTSQYESTTEVSATGSWKQVYKSHAYSIKNDLSYTIPLNEGICISFSLKSTSRKQERVASPSMSVTNQCTARLMSSRKPVVLSSPFTSRCAEYVLLMDASL